MIMSYASYREAVEADLPFIARMQKNETQKLLICALLAVDDTLKVIAEELRMTGPKTTPFLFAPPRNGLEIPDEDE